MADIILSRKEMQSIIDGEQLNNRYTSLHDSAYMPVPLAIDVIEKGKKGVKIPSDLKKLINCLPVYVNIIPLSTHGLYKAMCERDFYEKYINRGGNPFEFATEACLYEYDGWWEMPELLESLLELSWI